MIDAQQSSIQSASAVKSAASLGRGLFRPSSSGFDVDIFNQDEESAQNQVLMFFDEADKLSSSGHSLASTVPCSDDSSDDAPLLDEEGEWNSSNVDKIAKLWELSAQQRAELEQMGRRLQDIDHSKNNPGDVMRFIRARPGDLDAAETMFRNMIQWRVENNVDTILQDYEAPQDLLEYWPGCTMDGLDKDGDAICVDRGGRLDVPGLLARLGHDDFIRFQIWLRENPNELKWVKEFEARNGRPMKQMTIIEDLSGLKFRQLLMNREVRNMLGEISRMDQDNYPENAKRIIIIGVPNAFMVVWNAIKHLFDDGLCEKMIFSSSKGAERVLAKYIDLEVLPDCIVPGIGKGRAIEGMSNDIEGGPVPLNT